MAPSTSVLAPPPGRHAGRVLPIAIGVLLVLLPLQWVKLASFLGLALKPVHLAAGALAVSLLTIRAPGRHVRSMLRATGPFALTFFLFLVVNAAALMWTMPMSSGMPIVVKATAYFGVFLLLTTLMTAVDDDILGRVTRRAAPLGVWFFAVIVVAVFALIGRNFLSLAFGAVARGDTNWLQFGFYPVIFRFAGGRGGADAATFGTALRNTLVGAFLLYFLLVNAYRMQGASSGRIKGLILTTTAILAAGFIVLSVSRSNILALVLCLLIAAAYRLRSLSGRTTWRTAATVTLAIGVLASAAVSSSGAWDGPGAVLRDRFSGLEQNSRLTMYRHAMLEIEQRPWMGTGLGTEVPAAMGKDHRVHNLFLASWLETGLAGLVTSGAYYLAILLTWAVAAVRTLLRPRTWRLAVRPGWIMALPVLPLLRALLSGGGGGFTLIEWIFLATFFAALARNAALRNPAAAPSPTG